MKARLRRFRAAGLAFVLAPFAAPTWPADDVGALLAHADSIKSARYDEFVSIIGRLERDRTGLSPAQEIHLRYLRGWQLGYVADFDASVAMLEDVAARADDPTLHFRAEASIVNVLTVARRYQDSLLHLDKMLALLPQVTDPNVRGQGLLTATQIHIQVGQYDVGTDYADQLIREKPIGKVLCCAIQLKTEARLKAGRLAPDDSEAREGLRVCEASGEVIFANLIRTHLAKLDVATDRADDAIAVLQANYDDVQKSQYVRLISDYDALLAAAYWKKRQFDRVRLHAQRAIDLGGSQSITEPLVEAYRLLYLVAKEQGDVKAALAYHETFAAADKRYLDDVGARELTYQMVKHQATANRLQIDALAKQNQVLSLQRALGLKAVETSRLYIALLIGGLAFIAMWAWKTKRSQLHFMKLARRDGLTGIFNRHHFADAAESILEYCRKSSREACVIMIDLDHFKSINDEHGHSAGDIVLKRTVQACQLHLRSIDIFGRLGGEEFGIVLPDCDPERARQMAEQFRLAIAGVGSNDGGVRFPVSASFGVTATSWSGYELRQLVAHADIALYQAKRLGRNRVVMFDRSTGPEPVPFRSFDRRRA